MSQSSPPFRLDFYSQICVLSNRKTSQVDQIELVVALFATFPQSRRQQIILGLYISCNCFLDVTRQTKIIPIQGVPCTKVPQREIFNAWKPNPRKKVFFNCLVLVSDCQRLIFPTCRHLVQCFCDTRRREL